MTQANAVTTTPLVNAPPAAPAENADLVSAFRAAATAPPASIVTEGAPVEVAAPAADGTPGVTADPATEAAATGEPPPAEPAAPTTDERLARAQRAADKARADSRRNAALRAERDQLSNQQRVANTELERLRGLERTLRADPLGAMKQLGYTKETLAQAAIQEGKPEELMARLQTKLDEVTNAAEARVKALEQSIQQERNVARQQRVEADFLQGAKDAKRFPHLASHPAHVILVAGKAIHAEAFQRTGRDYSNREILAFLESQYAGTTQASPTKPKVAATSQGSSPSQAAPHARTISNDLAAASFTRPANWESLDSQEQDKYLVRMLKARRKPE